MNKTLYFYQQKFEKKRKQFDVPSQLPDYFEQLIGDKESVLIAEIGAGPVNTIGNEWPGVKVEIVASDVLWKDYEKLWNGDTPLVPITYEDMENLSYPDETFDIVHCRNAVDHTPNPLKAIEEMKRVCKKGGWIYMAHSPSQKTRFGGMHSVDFETLELPGFEVSSDGELIVSIWKKT